MIKELRIELRGGRNSCSTDGKRRKYYVSMKKQDLKEREEENKTKGKWERGKNGRKMVEKEEIGEGKKEKNRRWRKKKKKKKKKVVDGGEHCNKGRGREREKERDQ